MGNKVIFDPIERLIIITSLPVDGVITIDVNTDIYSDGKEDWLIDTNLTKMIFPIGVVGGDPISDSKNLGATFFVKNGWKIKPYEDNHTLIIVGNIYSDDGTSPFVSTDGTFNVSIQREVSNIIDGVASPSQISAQVWNDSWQPYVKDSLKIPTFGNRLGKKTQLGIFAK